jgi:hypothetical protein
MPGPWEKYAAASAAPSNKEGTYRMVSPDKAGTYAQIPYSGVISAQQQGYKFQDDNERGRWRKDYNYDIRKNKPLFSQDYWDADSAVFPDDTPTTAFVNRTMGAISSPVVHPVETLKGLGKTAVMLAQGPGWAASDMDSPIQQRVMEGVNDYQNSGAAFAGAKVAGDALGAFIGGKAMGGAFKAASPFLGDAATAVAARLRARGIKTVNRTVGALQDDFRHGVNIGRGYINEQIPVGPSANMESIADKAAGVQEKIGARIGNVIDDATQTGVRIPASYVADQLQPIVDAEIAAEMGPGGGGNITRIQKYWANFKPVLEAAERRGGFTPRELWDLKHQLQERTNWGDPAQNYLNKVKQAHYGVMTGILGDALPELRPLNQTYADLGALAERAQNRANTGSRPLTGSMSDFAGKAMGAAMGSSMGTPGAIVGAETAGLLKSVPIRTAYASGLNALSKGFARAGSGALSDLPAAGAVGVGIGAKEKVPYSMDGVGNSNPDRNGLNESQSTPPGSNNRNTGPLRGADLWVDVGSRRLKQHLALYPNGLTDTDVDALAQTPEGRRMLIDAGEAVAGSKKMRSIADRAKTSSQHD